MKWLALIFILLIFLNSCSINNKNLDERNNSFRIVNDSCFKSMGNCKTDNDCVVDGCNGEICRSVDIGPTPSICIYKSCFENSYSCRCVNNKCRWVSTS